MHHLPCPRCQTPLATHTLGTVTLDGCSGCGGLLVPLRSLAPLLKSMTVDDPGGPLPKVPDHGQSAPCPLCAQTMSNYGYMGASFVTIDRCAACDLVFIDDGELQAMAVHHQRTTDRVDSQSDFTFEELRRTFHPRGYSGGNRFATGPHWILPGRKP